jgi:tetratricopeptide (TPR) repeat protein
MKNNQKELIIVIITLFILPFLLYFKSLGAPFVFDDGHMIVRNNLIKNLSLLKYVFTSGNITSVPIVKGMYRPLLMLSFAFNYFFGRLNPFGYHIINIMFHFLNAVLLFFLLRILLPKRPFWPAVLSVLLFVVHPINSEAVIYISCRSTLMFSFFFLAGLLSYAKSAKIYDRYFYLSVAAFICGLLSKEPMIMFPFILVTYDLLYRRKSATNTPLFLRPYLLFALVALAYLLLRQYLIGGIATIRPFRGTYENILTQLHVTIFYLRLFFYPVNLCLGRFFQTEHSLMFPAVVQSVFIITALLSFVIYFWKKISILSFAILWYFFNLIPKFIGNLALVATEHHLYLSGMGIIMVTAVIFNEFYILCKKREGLFLKRIGILIFTIVFIVLALLTFQRNRIWKDEYSIWLNNIKYSPMAWGAYNNLGLVALNEGKYDEAFNYFNRALEGAKGLPSDSLMVNLYTNLSKFYLIKGNFDSAEAELKKALEIDPKVAEIHNNLGLVYAKKGLRSKEIFEFQLAIALDPTLIEAYDNLAASYWLEKKSDLAIKILERAIEINPDYAKSYLILAKIFEYSGNLQKAIELKEQALNLLPIDANDYFNLGTMYGKIGDIKALDYFKKAIELEPNFAAAHNNLAVTYANLTPPRLESARSHARLALKYGYKVNPALLKQLGISQ